MLTIEEYLKQKNFHFKGICVQDAQKNGLVKELRVTLGWVLDINRAKRYKQILISGNDKMGDDHPDTNCGINWHKKERRFFFIADIVKIVNVNDFLRETDGWADDAIRKHHCGAKFPILHSNWGENRHAIYFENATETYNCEEDYRLWQSSVKYIY